jgi:pSer/pThr/pTyr-binding forkhead associated (FHA) protein
VENLTVDELLLILKIGFLVLLYLFIWRIVASASRDIRSPNESMIIAPGHVASPVVTPLASRPGGRLVVVTSPTLTPGEEHELDSAPFTVGRASANDIELHGDDFASATHARFEPRNDGVWVHDLGSTNGTFVNGVKVGSPRKLRAGDVVRVGETDLRYDR